MEIDWVSWIQLSATWLPLDYHFHSTCLPLGDHLTIISSWSDSIVLMSFYHSEVIQLTRACFGPVYWNKGVSILTRGCSNIQVQNNPELNFVWLLFEFHQSDIILSFWCHFIILISFYHLEVIPLFWCYSIILISFHHPEAIPFFWCHSIVLKSFNWHGVVLELCIGTRACQIWLGVVLELCIGTRACQIRLGVVPIYRSRTTLC